MRQLAGTEADVELLFYKKRPATWLDWAIRQWLWSDYSHVELRLESRLIYSSSWRDGGVRFRELTVKDASWDRVAVEMTPAESWTVARWCSRHAAGRYDLLGACGLAFGRKAEHPQKWYCSEIVSEAIRATLKLDFPRRTSPGHLFRDCLKYPERFRLVLPGEGFRTVLDEDLLARAKGYLREARHVESSSLQTVLARRRLEDPLACGVAGSLIEDPEGQEHWNNHGS